MQEAQTESAEAIHAIYEKQVAATDEQMIEKLWDRIAALAATSAGLRMERKGRVLTIVDAASGRTLRLAADEILDVPESERPGPFGMGNARVTITAWDGTTRTWLLRHVGAGLPDYAWVSLPGDVIIDDALLTRLLGGLTSGVLPPHPAETAHVDPTAPEAGTLATGHRWVIANLYSGQHHHSGEVYASGQEAGDALKALVRSGAERAGDWEVRPLDGESAATT